MTETVLTVAITSLAGIITALAGVPVPAGLRDALVQWQRLTGERSSRDPDPRADP